MQSIKHFSLIGFIIICGYIAILHIIAWTALTEGAFGLAVVQLQHVYFISEQLVG
jgi:hypothetical protein